MKHGSRYSKENENDEKWFLNGVDGNESLAQTNV